MMSAAEPMNARYARSQIEQLKRELADVTQQCDAAAMEGVPGCLFFLLRKKWSLTQQIFEAENKLLLAPRSSQAALDPD